MNRRSHWERIYESRRPEEVSWFQPRATLSFELMTSAVPDRGAPILDVGAGASTLIDDLLEAGYRRLTVLDIAAHALDVVRDRLGAGAADVSFVRGDVTTVRLEPASVALWHDRAVFHFLTDAEDRRRYVDQVRHAVAPGGFVLMATFAEDGPTRCSGLDVSRYSPDLLHATFGSDFELVETRREYHRTPSGVAQAFTYCLCRFRPAAGAQPVG
jgi:SAM-dependent methyltransferase